MESYAVPYQDNARRWPALPDESSIVRAVFRRPNRMRGTVEAWKTWGLEFEITTAKNDTAVEIVMGYRVVDESLVPPEGSRKHSPHQTIYERLQRECRFASRPIYRTFLGGKPDRRRREYRNPYQPVGGWEYQPQAARLEHSARLVVPAPQRPYSLFSLMQDLVRFADCDGIFASHPDAVLELERAGTATVTYSLPLSRESYPMLL